MIEAYDFVHQWTTDSGQLTSSDVRLMIDGMAPLRYTCLLICNCTPDMPITNTNNYISSDFENYKNNTKPVNELLPGRFMLSP